MPYITQEKREQLNPTIDALSSALDHLECDSNNQERQNNMKGNINYVLTRLLMQMYGDRDSTRYANINDAMGILTCVQQEFYRKVAAGYEDQKEFENGSVTGD